MVLLVPAGPKGHEPSRLRRRFALAVPAFALLLMSTFAGTLFPVGPEEAKRFQEDIAQRFTGMGFAGVFGFIFLNNFAALLLMHVPLLGLLFGIYVTFSTGTFLGGLSALSGVNPALALVTTFVLPHAIPEFFAYSLAFVESYICAKLVWRRRFREAARDELTSMISSGAILAAAAAIEAALILLLGV